MMRRMLGSALERRGRDRIAVATPFVLLFALLFVSAACTQDSETPPESAMPESGTEAARSSNAHPAPARPLAPSGRPYSEDREACADRTPDRRALWGELHVHSALSMDAYLWDVRNGPDETFRFAKGERTFFPPLDEEGQPTRAAQLERPIDFVALTDHASFQGEVALCTRPGSPVYDSEGCKIYRAEIDLSDSPYGDTGARMGALSGALDPTTTEAARSQALCEEDGARCRDSMQSVWLEQQAAAERHYDRSSRCSFTTLHGYEYTATPGLAKIHHNVIFRNATVPPSPIAWVDTPDVYDLWQALDQQCRNAGLGCDVLTIPHNSNLSNGNMFAVTGKDLPLEIQRARAQLRAEIEVLAEVTQIKGDSECRNGMYQVMGKPDEFCDYEEWRGPEVADCEEGTGFGALLDQGCVSRNDYLRYALLEGLREDRRIGVNPYKIGFIAATDAHNANPGDVEEYSYQGWSGAEDASAKARLTPSPSPINASNALAANPGGLAGVWAEENSRDSIFDAMQRKETFGTSGPRIEARLFGGWALAEDLCDAPDFVRAGYESGVPMGADLPPRPDDVAGPRFAVSALRDPGTPAHPGGLLQRAQIVKGWVDQAGLFHQRVYDVAGGANGADVDLDSCEPRGTGSPSLCTVWDDPEFDPALDAVYYLRVLENPSCRWNQRQCLELPASERPASCSDPQVPKTIQERLWTSPIWYDAPA